MNNTQLSILFRIASRLEEDLYFQELEEYVPEDNKALAESLGMSEDELSMSVTLLMGVQMCYVEAYCDAEAVGMETETFWNNFNERVSYVLNNYSTTHHYAFYPNGEVRKVY